MLRRLFALVVLVGIVAMGLYLWNVRSTTRPNLDVSAQELGADARALGAQAQDKLGAVGQKIEDVKVAASVRTALSLNRSLHPYSIAVSSDDGVVTLRGTVDGEETRTLAETVAARVPDVVRVLNQIQATSGAAIVPTGERTMGERLDERTLQLQVKLALSLSRELKGSDIQVDVDRHEVTLSGEATRAQGDLAVEVARGTNTVGSVVDRIRVRGLADGGPSTGHSPATASAARASAAQQALGSNANLAGFDLKVAEEEGRLVLRGHLTTSAEKDLAGLVAREGAGGPVENLAEVRSGTQ